MAATQRTTDPIHRLSANSDRSVEGEDDTEIDPECHPEANFLWTFPDGNVGWMRNFLNNRLLGIHEMKKLSSRQILGRIEGSNRHLGRETRVSNALEA